MKAYSIFLIFFLASTLLSCKKKYLDPPEITKNISNLPPTSFKVAIKDVKSTSFILEWTESYDPEYEKVNYSIVLENQQIASNILATNFEIKNLNPNQVYTGKVIALDPSGNKSEMFFTTKTDDKWLKFSRSYTYLNSAGAVATSIASTQDGGYIVAGQIALSTQNILVFKLDSAGNDKWFKILKCEFPLENIVTIKVLDTGDFIVAGANYIYRLSESGEVVWSKKLYSSDGSPVQLNSFIIMQDKNLLFAERSSSSFCLLKMNILGQTLWEKSLSDNNGHNSCDVIEDKNGDIYALGEKRIGNDNNFWLFRLDRNASVLWEKDFGDGKYDFSASIRIKNNGNVVIGGTSEGLFYAMHFLEIDKSGVLIKDFTLNTEQSDYVNGIDVTSDGGIIVALRQETGYGGRLGILKFDSQWNTLWNEKYSDNEQYGQGRSVFETKDKGYIIAGGRGTFSTTGRPYKALIVKTNDKGRISNL